MASVSERLLEIRNSEGLSQREIAEKLMLPQRTWANYETGRSEIPLKIGERLSSLGYSLEWIISGEGQQRKDHANNKPILFEIPLLTKQEALSFNHKKEIPNPVAHSGEYPQKIMIPVPLWLQEFSTDLRAISVFNSRMVPILNPGDVAVFEATGWNGNGTYLLVVAGSLQFASVTWEYDQYKLSTNFELREPLIYSSETCRLIGRIRAVVKRVE